MPPIKNQIETVTGVVGLSGSPPVGCSLSAVETAAGFTAAFPEAAFRTA